MAAAHGNREEENAEKTLGVRDGNDGSQPANPEAPAASVDKIWNASFASVFTANALLSLGQQMVNVLIALYADSLGADSTLVGFAVSSFAYAALAFKVVSGPATDAFDRKKILVAALALVAVAYFSYAASTNIVTLILARLLQGTAMAFTFTCCLAMATDALPQDKVSSGIGYFSLAQAACMAVGPMVGLMLADAFGYHVAFVAAGCMMAVAVVAALRVKQVPRERKPFKISARNVFAFEATVPAVISALLVLAFCNVNSFLALYAGERGVDNIGLYFTVNAVLMLFSRPLVGKLADRHGLLRVLLPSIACFAASFAIISQADALWKFLVAAVFSAFGYGAAGPMLEACCMKSVPPERRGAGSSAYFIGVDVGNLAGPVIAGSVAGAVGYQDMWLAMLAPIALAFVLAVAFRRRIAQIDRGYDQRV